MTTPGVDGTYRFTVEVVQTTQGTGGTCTTGAVAAQVLYTNPDNNTAYTVSVPMRTENAAPFATTMSIINTANGQGAAWVAAPFEFRAKSGVAIKFQMNVTQGNNCTTVPVITIRPALYGPLSY
jgi:hypothetical protein